MVGGLGDMILNPSLGNSKGQSYNEYIFKITFSSLRKLKSSSGQSDLKASTMEGRSFVCKTN